MKRTLAICLVCLFCSCYLHAQNKTYVESESYKYNMDYVDALINKADFYIISGNTEKAIQIEKEKVDILAHLLDNDSIDDVIYDWYKLEYINTLKRLAALFNKTGDFENRDYYCDLNIKSCLKYYGELSKEYIVALSFHAFYYFESGYCNKAIELEGKALNIQEKEGIIDSTAYAISFLNMATYNRTIGNLNDALNFVQRSIAILQADKSSSFYESALFEEVNCYIFLGDYDKAKEILNLLFIIAVR